MLRCNQRDMEKSERKQDEPQGTYSKKVPMGLSTLASCAYALHRSGMSLYLHFSSSTSLGTPRGGVEAGVGLRSRGLEMRLGNGRVLWVANMRICVLQSHNGGL